MSLKDCDIYCYAPDEDPFDGDDGSIWSLNYFVFNKAKKRVLYLYLRGLSAISSSPSASVVKRNRGESSVGDGARKRARYWLGDRADAEDFGDGGWGEDDEEYYVEESSDDDADMAPSLIDVRSMPIVIRDTSIEKDSSGSGSDAESSDEPSDVEMTREESAVRAVSEQIADSIEV
jgi:hypothetical protein